MTRERLPNRRAHEAFAVAFSRQADGFGTAYTFGLGRYPDGRPGEVFLDCGKVSTDATDDARDMAVVLSVALQHGMPIAELAAAVARHEDGRPCSLIGRVADVLTEREAARIASGDG